MDDAQYFKQFKRTKKLILLTLKIFLPTKNENDVVKNRLKSEILILFGDPYTKGQPPGTLTKK